MTKTIGFIGCGNMGGAIAEAVAKTNVYNKILLSDTFEDKAISLAKKICADVSDNEKIASVADVIVLGVKPQMLKAAIDSIKETVTNRNVLIISMAAGVDINKLESYFNSPVAIIRIMPNTPVAVGEGMILYCINESVDVEQLTEFTKAMAQAGKLDKLPEKLIDAASALSGCGPAFVYMFIEALADGGVACGLPRDKAMAYACQTLLGSATLLSESKRHPGELKDAVCSPAGSTIVGVKTLEKGCVRGTVINAVINAYERTKELGK